MTDLRHAMNRLDDAGELEHVRAPTAARYAVSSFYAAYSGVPAAPPTGPGPAVLFHDVRPAGNAVALGVFGSRRRCAAHVDSDPASLPARLLAAATTPLEPVTEERPVERERQANVDLTRLPLLTVGAADAGPYLTLGLVLVAHPQTGRRNISVHRMAVQGPDTVTIWMVPGRNLETCVLAAREQGRALPVAIHLGLDPAVYLASCLGTRIAPLGTDELAVAGRLRGAAVGLRRCASVGTDYIDHAEWVLEGEVTTDVIAENVGRPEKGSMPEFLGYDGAAHPALPVIQVHGVSHRPDPVLQAVVGPGLEQSSLLAFGAEAALLVRFADLGVTVDRVHCSTAGGGQLLAFVAVRDDDHDGETVREAAAEVLRSDRMLKTVVLVDEDVDVESHEDVWWAMTTRMQSDRDVSVLKDQHGFPLDPSQSPEYSPSLSASGRSAKTVFDCTIPRRLRSRFRRSQLVVDDLSPP